MFDFNINYSTSPPPPRRRRQSRISPGLQNLWTWFIFLLSLVPFKKIASFTKLCTIWKKIMWFIDILGSAPAPPPDQEIIVSSSSSDPNHSQKAITSERTSTDRYIEVSPYDRSKDNQRVQKVLKKLGGVTSWKVSSDGKLIVSTVQRPETLINALKHEFSSNRRIKISQKSEVTSQDKVLQMVGKDASKGLIKSVEYKETTTKEGTKTKAVKFNYVDRDEGTFTSREAPSVSRVLHYRPWVTNRSYY